MTDFRHFALCRDVDPEVFFPVGTPGTPAFENLAAPARAICADCPVAVECLEFALRSGCDDGIFGGLDSAQRRVLNALPRASHAARPVQPAGRAA